MIIGIDPSINHVGISYLRAPYDPQTIELMQVDSSTQSRGVENRAMRHREIGNQVISRIRLLGLHSANVGIIEFPAFQDSQRGHVAAKQGHTFGLAWMCGFMAAKMPDTVWFTPTPIEWKGTLGKEAMGHRFQRWTGKFWRDYSDHEYESACMIKWYLDKYGDGL